MSVFGFAWTLLGSGGVAAQPKNTLAEEMICKNIGFRPKTEAFGGCVLELIDRNLQIGSTSAVNVPRNNTGKPRDLLVEDAQYQRQANARRAKVRPTQTASKPAPAAVKPAAREVATTIPLSPNEQTCASYSFKRGTQAFGGCLMQLDQIQQQAMLAERQHQLQLAQYQQQVAAYEEQQRAIKKEKDRRKWEAIGRLGAGMANSTSPSFLGALNEGLAAANGYPIAKPPALPPSPPAFQNYTIRGPNGDQIYCSYNTAARYMSCR